jgi:hypothetical protein
MEPKYSTLDFPQIIQRLFDDTQNRLMVHAKTEDTSEINVLYSESLSVEPGVQTPVLAFLATARTKIIEIEASGSNIATFELISSTGTLSKKRTYFGVPLNVEFNLNSGLVIEPGQTIILMAYHQRPYVGDFNATLKYMEM